MTRTRPAALALVALLVALGVAACQPGPTSLTIALDRNEIDLGESVRVTGTASPGRSGLTVVFQRRAGDRWVDWGWSGTDARGAYDVKQVTPAAPGIYTVRTVVGGTASPTRYLRVWDRVHLDTLFTTSGHVIPQEGTQVLSGKSYPRSLHTTFCHLGQTIIEWDIGRRFSRFETVLGIADGAPAQAQRRYELRGGGTLLASGLVRTGVPNRIDVDVRGMQRIRIEFSAGTLDCGSEQAAGRFVLGRPVLWR